MQAAFITKIVQFDIWIMPEGNDHGEPVYDKSFTAQEVIDSMLEDGYIEDELASGLDGDLDEHLVTNAFRMAGLRTDNYGHDVTEYLEDEGKHLVLTYYRR